MFAVAGSSPVVDVEQRGVSKGFLGAMLFLLLIAGVGSWVFWTKTHTKPVDVVDRQASLNAVQAADAAWAKAASARNLDDLVSLYADDAIVMPPNVAMATDKASQRTAWAKILVPGSDISFSVGKTEASKAGDLVYDVGVYSLIKKTGKVQTTDGGKYLTVWKKQADGSWKMEAQSWNSDANGRTTR
jgi:ketosteroid isomerase-like protein